jgi:hypothetical protein
MKPVFIATVTLCLFAFRGKAQCYRVGTNVYSIGVGVGSAIAGNSYSSQTPGFNLQWERGFWKAGPGVISLGYYQGYKAFNYTSPDYWEKWWYTILGISGAYHLTGLNVDHLDLYAGLMPSYNLADYTYNGPNYSGAHKFNNKLSLSAFAGARFFFFRGFGAFAELGYGVSYLHLGLSYGLL